MVLGHRFARLLAAALLGAGLGGSGLAFASPAQASAPVDAASPRSAYYLNFHTYAWAGDYSSQVLHYYRRCASPAPCTEAHPQAKTQAGLHIAELMNLGHGRRAEVAGGQDCTGCPATGAGATQR